MAKDAEEVITIVLPPPVAISLLDAIKESINKQRQLLIQKKKEEKNK